MSKVGAAMRDQDAAHVMVLYTIFLNSTAVRPVKDRAGRIAIKVLSVAYRSCTTGIAMTESIMECNLRSGNAGRAARMLLVVVRYRPGI